MTPGPGEGEVGEDEGAVGEGAVGEGAVGEVVVGEGAVGEVVVLAAMPREIRPLVRTLRLRPRSVAGMPAWRGRGAVAAAVGVGPARAGARSAEVLDAVHARRVLVLGVAGALDPSLRVGDVVRPLRVVDARTGAVLEPRTTARRAGVLVTVEQIFVAGTRRGEGAARAVPDDATAVDMETAAIAAVCEARGIAWDVVRAVSDVAGSLDPAVASLLRPDGRADVVGAARLVLRDPRALRPLVRLGLDTALAVRRATSVVVSELAASGVREGRAAP